jgi:Na+-transporting NADH:ubiquinone oxidoreductase subunit E
MEHFITLFFRSIFVDNMIFAFFLGMCSFLAVSKNVKTSLGLGLALHSCCLSRYLLTICFKFMYLVLIAWYKGVDLSYLSFILFIAVIAGITQLVEMAVEKYSPSLYSALGIFLPLDCRQLCYHGCIPVYAATYQT